MRSHERILKIMKEETVSWIWTIFCGFLIILALINPEVSDMPFSERSFVIFLCVPLWLFGGMMIKAFYVSGGSDWGRADDDDIGGE